MVVAHNLSAMNSNRQFKINTKSKAKTAEKLASGYRINRAADDAAGLAISEKMRKQIRGLEQGVQNTQDGISLCQVADGALAEVHEMLQRANELAVQAANGTNSDSDRKAIQMEVDALKQEIDRISDTTSFNDLKLFQVDIKSNLEGINNSYSSLDIDALMKTFKVTGTPIDTTELTYIISADMKKGISINGTEIAWNNIQDMNGNNLSDADIKEGTYTFIYNGSSISFDIEDKTNLKDIAIAIDNIEINLIPSYSYNRLKKATFESNYTNVKSGTYTFFANDYALGIKEPGATYGLFSKVWDRTLIYDTTSNVFEIQLSNTSGVYANLKLEFEEIPTREEIINAVDGITVDTYFDKIQYTSKSNMREQIVDASTGTITYVERCTAGISRVNDEFCNEHGMAIYNQGYTFTLEGDDFAVPWKYTYNNKEYFLTAESEQKLDNITLNGGVSEGDVITLTFSNGVGEFDVSYNIKQANVDARDAITIKGTNGYVGKMDIMTSIKPIYCFYNDVKLKEQKPDIYVFDIKKINIDDKDSFIKSKESNCIWIQSGAEANDGMYLEIDKMNTQILGIDELDVTTQDSATESIDIVEKALNKLSKSRSKIGAQQNRLEHTVANENNIIENTTAAESRIRDTDMAKEMVKLSMQNILEQANTSIMAQTNQSNQGVLSLLNN